MKKKNNLFNYLIIFFAVVLFGAFPFFQNLDKSASDSSVVIIRHKDSTVILTYILICLLSAANVIVEFRKRTFSLNLAHWLFLLFFMGYAPLVQYTLTGFPRQAYIGRLDNYFFLANCLLLVWIGVYSAVYHFGTRWLRVRIPPLQRTAAPSFNFILAFIILITASAAVIQFYGIKGLSYRYGFNEDSGSFSKAYMLIISVFIRCIPVVMMGLYIGLKKEKSILANGFFLTLLVLTLVTNNPLALPRYYSGAVIIGYLLFLVRQRKISGAAIPVGIIVGLLVVMPLLDLTRWKPLSEVEVENVTLQGTAERLSSGDFDAYSMYVNTLKYTERFPENQNGQQILGALFFFVPREMWPDKPVGSGQYLAERYNLRFTNLSEPLMAEGLINLGIAGLVLFAGGLALFNARLDKSYWADPSPYVNTYLKAIYPFLFGLLVFLLRGDLQNGFAFTAGFATSGFLLYRILTWMPRAD